MLSRFTVRQLGWLIAFSVVVMLLMPMAPHTGPFSAVYGPVAAIRTLQMVGLVFWLMVVIAHAIFEVLSHAALRQHQPAQSMRRRDTSAIAVAAILRC
jgi:uncharacterized membrane protein